MYIIFFILAVVIVLAAAFFWARMARWRHISDLFNLRLLSVELSRRVNEKETPKQELLSEIGKSSQLLSVLANLKIPFALEAAVHNVGEDILFYLAVPEKAVAFAVNQVHGLWPDAQVKPADEYTIFRSDGAASAAYVKLKHSYILPIRTYREAELDTFASVASGFSKLQLAGEGMALQVLVRPATHSAKDKVVQAMYKLKKGRKLSDVLEEPFIDTPKGFKQIGSFFDALEVKSKKKEPDEPVIVDEEAAKVMAQKIAQPLFEVNVRLVAGADMPLRSDGLLEELAGAFSQFGAPMRNEFRIIKPRTAKNLVFKYAMREFDASQAMVLNAEEIASIFHLPSHTTDVPKIKWLKAKQAPPPTFLPTEGVRIGESVFRGEHKPVYLTDEDRRRHVYTVGQTGTGKSTLMTAMAIDDINRGKGVAIIDPHGDLIETILGFIPPSRIDDLIVFDPSDRARPLGMNMLEYDITKPEEKTFIVNELFNILDKLYDMKTVGGPMFEQYTKNAILLLMEDAVNEPATLMEMPRVFTDPDFRARKLARITNPVVIDFWQKEAAKATGEHSLANMAPYITSKFNNFISNDYVRPIIGQPVSAFNFRKVMDEGKILLVNLSKGRIGDINAGLLGMVITGKILLAALSRVDIADQDARRDFNLYIDEFQNFTTDSISTILSEARKYRLNLTMAHQFIGQLTDKIKDAVFGNVGSLISFRVGAEDAEFLIKQFEPVFSKNDLVNIDNFNAYAKLLMHGQTSPPFTLRINRVGKGNAQNIAKLKEYTGLKYGADRETVERDIINRLRTPAR